MSGRPWLAVFAGLPGVGKTAVACGVADALGVTFVRIDTVEAAIASTLMPVGESPVGYLVGARVAAETQAELRFVHVICSEAAEHRRRVESRGPEMPGHGVPDWEQVGSRRWDAWTEPHLEVDNAGPAADSVAQVLAALR